MWRYLDNYDYHATYDTPFQVMFVNRALANDANISD